MNDVLNNAYNHVANELNLCVDDVKKAYMSIFKFQKEVVVNFNFQECDSNNKVFLVPSIGKFFINVKKYKGVKRVNKND